MTKERVSKDLGKDKASKEVGKDKVAKAPKRMTTSKY